MIRSFSILIISLDSREAVKVKVTEFFLQSVRINPGVMIFISTTRIWNLAAGKMELIHLSVSLMLYPFNTPLMNYKTKLL